MHEPFYRSTAQPSQYGVGPISPQTWDKTITDPASSRSNVIPFFQAAPVNTQRYTGTPDPSYYPSRSYPRIGRLGGEIVTNVFHAMKQGSHGWPRRDVYKTFRPTFAPPGVPAVMPAPRISGGRLGSSNGLPLAWATPLAVAIATIASYRQRRSVWSAIGVGAVTKWAIEFASGIIEGYEGARRASADPTLELPPARQDGPVDVDFLIDDLDERIAALKAQRMGGVVGYPVPPFDLDDDSTFFTTGPSFLPTWEPLWQRRMDGRPIFPPSVS
ncbi:MAG: hypothetical protein Q8R92_17920 [Deltaproteobacteria bacterium]|nr:hypothetical protein [Deltaproteobacteria bacterium]